MKNKIEEAHKTLLLETIKTKHNNLVKLGAINWKAWEHANTKKGYWRISNSPILVTTFTNKYLID